MSGLAAGIRLAMFGHRVLILERHNAPGGLNSFYFLRGRKYDVGLHAVTNYVPPGVKGTPLGKLCRQLRLSREELGLRPQVRSRIAFPGADLYFGNGGTLLEESVDLHFPRQVDGFRRLRAFIEGHRELDLAHAHLSAREVVRSYLGHGPLAEMLFCPLMYYGSPTEGDMDLDQFAVMFKAVFLEGFSRPAEGVRPIIRALLSRYRACGGERRMRCGVRRLHLERGRVRALELDDGSCLTSEHVLSSAGLLETQGLLHPERSILDREEAEIPAPPAREKDAEAPHGVGRLSFVESISVLQEHPQQLGWGDTITFFNDSDRFHYERPREHPTDYRSGVICLPDNYAYGDDERPDLRLLRVTCIASHPRWTGLSPERYAEAKGQTYGSMTQQACTFLPPLPPGLRLEEITVDRDLFTPATIERFTGHLGGAVYGSPCKARDGTTAVPNLFLCGTDQGFLGIVGAMLSGISIVNRHLLTAHAP